VCDPATLGFVSTAELPPLDGMIGQDRALGATTFGIQMKHAGYNLFVLGPTATGRTTTMRRVLAQTAQDEPTPPDHCYVHNFSDPYRPTALELPAGRGRDLQQEMVRFVEECRVRLPRAFESEEFERQKSQILDNLAHRHQEEITRFEEAARTQGFIVLQSHGRLAVAPAPRGKTLSPEEFNALPKSVRDEIEARGHALEERLEATLRQLRQLEREARQAHEQLVSTVAAAATPVFLPTS